VNHPMISTLRALAQEAAPRQRRRLRVRGRYPTAAVTFVQTLLRHYQPKVLAKLFDVPVSSIYRWRPRECITCQPADPGDRLSRGEDVALRRTWSAFCEQACQTGVRLKFQGEDKAHSAGFVSAMPGTETTNVLRATRRKSRRKNVNERLDAARAKIESDFFQDIDTKMLAALTGFSRFNFIRSFKKRFSLSPHQYLLKTRMDAARKLLEHSTESITVVAAATGFRSAYCLNRRFKQMEGRSISASFPILKARKIRVSRT